jgi:hypothetical protein
MSEEDENERGPELSSEKTASNFRSGVRLKAEPLPAKAEGDDGEDVGRFRLEGARVAPFPRKRFMQFLRRQKVNSKDYGTVEFRLLGSQLYLIDEIERAMSEGVTTIYVLKSRQVGISTLLLALDMFWSFEHPGLLGVFMLHKEEAREDFRTVIEVFFAETPKQFKVEKIRHNRAILMLKNGSKFRYLVAGAQEAKRGGLGRSGAANYLHSTETAFYGDGDALNEFRAQMSGHYAHRLQIYESTANGFNHFEEAWQQAKKDPTKWTVFIGWWRDERNQLPTDHPFFLKHMPDGLNERLTALERQRCRLVKQLYGIDVSLQQVAWYRWHLASEKEGDQSLMDQEFPWTEDDAFISTGSNFFTTLSLTEATKVARRLPFWTYRYKFALHFEDVILQQTRDPRAPLRVWEEASKFGYYTLGCDPAFGSSDQADRSVVSVWRGYADCMVQVAEFCSTEPSTYQTAWVVAHLAGYYGLQWLMPVIEITGPGQAVFDELEKIRQLSNEIRAQPGKETPELRNILQNMRHFLYRRIDALSGGLAYQWRTSGELKSRMMNQFKNGIELKRIVPRSVPLLEEMRKVVNDEGWIGAEGRAHDDRVIGAALAHQGWVTWLQPRLKRQGLTLAEAAKQDEHGGVEPFHRLVTNFLKKQNIAVPVPPPEAPT